jgi:hypothetical protein
MLNRILKTFVILASISIFVTSCVGTLAGTGGILTIRFDLSNGKSAREISDDFQKVDTGKVFLKQGGVTQKQANVLIDKQAKSGTCMLTDITVGSYDSILELYDAGSRVIYSSVDTVSIAAGNNGVKQMTLERYIATLSLSGSWTEDIAGLASATAELKKSGTVIYGASLSLNAAGKTVSGGIQNVYPDTYDLYVEVKDSAGVV